MTCLYVGLGGTIGAILRFALGKHLSDKIPDFPLGTLVINVSGSFLLSLLFFYFQSAPGLNQNLYPALAIGMLGAYTAFSTFTLEALDLLQERRLAAAAAYVGGNVCLGLLAVAAGKMVFLA